MFARWPRRIGDVDICLVQLPGRENRLREPHYGSYEQLASDLAEGLLPYLDRPFGLFGHCGGALPAFATALHLMRSGLPTPAHFFVSSLVPPHEGPYGRFLRMSDDELAVELTKLIRAMGGTPHPELIEMNLGVLRADLAATRAYRIREPVLLPFAVHAIGWSADKEVSPTLMTGWREYAKPDQFHSMVIPGEHYTFLDPPEELLEELVRGMAQASQERTGISREPGIASGTVTNL